MSSIREARKELGLSQAEMAARLGVTQGTISKLETGALALDERTRLAVNALLIEHAAADTPAEQAGASGESAGCAGCSEMGRAA